VTRLVVLALLSASLCFGGCAAVFKPKKLAGYDFLGEVSAEWHNMAWHTFEVDPSTPYERIRFHVLRHDVQMGKVKVLRAGKKATTRSGKRTLKRRSVSPAISFDEPTAIRRVDVRLWSRGDGFGPARVRLYGRPAPD
jgi:hypothetical protein